MEEFILQNSELKRESKMRDHQFKSEWKVDRVYNNADFV